MLYTLVDPEPGYEVAYNRWYERDHFYGGCMTGPWCFAGSRWVATRELKDLRFPAEGNSISDPVDRGSYVAIYWVEDGHHDDHFAWGADQVVKLYTEGRGFQERRHAHTVLYRHRSNRYRDKDPVPVDLALDHHYAGIASVVVEPTGGAEPVDLDAWLDNEGLPPLFTDGPVASCAQWTAVPRDGMTSNAPMDLGSSPPGLDTTMQVFFLEEDPRPAGAGSWTMRSAWRPQGWAGLPRRHRSSAPRSEPTATLTSSGSRWVARCRQSQRGSDPGQGLHHGGEFHHGVLVEADVGQAPTFPPGQQGFHALPCRTDQNVRGGQGRFGV